MDKHRYGNSGVNFGPDGRIYSGNQVRDSTFPGRGKHQKRREDPVYRDYRSDDGLDRADQYRNMEKPPLDPRDARSRPYVYPPYYPYGGYTYKPYGNGRPPAYPDNSMIKKGWNDHVYNGYDKSGLIPQKGLRRERRSVAKIPWEVLFILIGIVILILAVANIVVCYEHHAYCRIWTGFLVGIYVQMSKHFFLPWCKVAC